MTADRLKIVILGLTITSSWGNGHATTYRSLISGLQRRGHSVLFLERDKPWYASNRDLSSSASQNVAVYDSVEALTVLWGETIAAADLVIVGSYVPEGIAIGHIAQRLARGVTAFYDIDTPVTLTLLEEERCDYLSKELIRDYGLYLSFTGGPTLVELQARWGAREAVQMYCAADPEVYKPLNDVRPEWDLGYLGTFSSDRQSTLEELLTKPAAQWPEGRFVVAGPLYPSTIMWPQNVTRVEHLPPGDHRAFYAAQRFTLNVTRSDMIKRGWSPSIRLFEAACCGTPIISDWWEGLDSIFKPDEEILIAQTDCEVLELLRTIPETRRLAIGAAARTRVLSSHTADHRVLQLEASTLNALREARRPTVS